MHVTATIAPADRAGGPQYMRALQRANQVRLARAALKRRVADGEIQVAEVILDCPWEAQSMTVADLLMSQRRWGATRSRKIMALLPLPERKTIGSLTHRQRGALAAVLIPPPQVRAGPDVGALGRADRLDRGRRSVLGWWRL